MSSYPRGQDDSLPKCKRSYTIGRSGTGKGVLFLFWSPLDTGLSGSGTLLPKSVPATNVSNAC